jgi:hypothetical protein
LSAHPVSSTLPAADREAEVATIVFIGRPTRLALPAQRSRAAALIAPALPQQPWATGDRRERERTSTTPPDTQPRASGQPARSTVEQSSAQNA